MTHHTDDPLREALEQIARTKYGLQGLLEDGESDQEIARYWSDLAHSYERIARAALAAAPQPAPAPADEREALIEMIEENLPLTNSNSREEAEYIADALLAQFNISRKDPSA